MSFCTFRGFHGFHVSLSESMAGTTGLEPRDLCRDSIPEGRNPLETGVVDGNLSALGNPG